MKHLLPSSSFSGPSMRLAVGLLVSLAVVLAGCGDSDEDLWIGTWTLESIDGLSMDEVFVQNADEFDISHSNTWEFRDDGTWSWNLSYVFEFRLVRGSFGASVDMTGTYTLSDSTYTLVLEDAESTISRELTEFGFTEAQFESIFFGGSETDTGTWQAQDDTLTLTSADGSIVVFQQN